MATNIKELTPSFAIHPGEILKDELEERGIKQKEFALLEYFLRNKGKVCRRTRIIEKVWDIHYDHDNSVIDVYINSLRKKLDSPDEPSFIITVRGVGYKIEADE